MAKYGRGLNRELVAAINAGIIAEPFNVADVRRLINLKRWHPEPPDSYVNVALANASSETHSPTFLKYFVKIGKGLYQLREEYKGGCWV
jgi:hypothetical protein